jgi:S1-C subfamily serine protease
VAVAPAAVAQRMRRAVGLPERHGILVLRVKRGSAAETAGLARGDLVTSAGASDVHTIGDLHRALAHAGASLKLDVVRGVEERAVTVALPADGR